MLGFGLLPVIFGVFTVLCSSLFTQKVHPKLLATPLQRDLAEGLTLGLIEERAGAELV